jgi:hypothetical protein
MTTKKKRKFICPVCGTPWDEYYLMELCQKVDLDNLEKGKDEKRNATNAIRRKKRA